MMELITLVTVFSVSDGELVTSKIWVEWQKEVVIRTVLRTPKTMDYIHYTSWVIERLQTEKRLFLEQEEEGCRWVEVPVWDQGQ